MFMCRFVLLGVNFSNDVCGSHYQGKVHVGVHYLALLSLKSTKGKTIRLVQAGVEDI
jgi:hypothetical protein